ncbi:MAG: colicin V production protein [Flavobacteriaceae bacterium]|nr:MAG: colicin V production protein [Flavobacteriaceae bacterium]
MSFLDIVLGLLLIWGLYKGFKNGLLIEIASIIALIAGIYGAIHFSYIAGNYLSINMEWNERYINITSFIITFIIIVLAVHFAGKLLTKVANIVLLGTINKIAGAIFGALKVAVIVGAFLVFFDGLNNTMHFVDEEDKKESIFYTPVKEIGAFVFGKVLKNEPFEETSE